MSRNRTRAGWILAATVFVGLAAGRQGTAWQHAPPVHGASPSATPDDEGWQRMTAGASDYAPAGMPDFDQRQSHWKVETVGRARWTHDGPTALAEVLWWLDSRLEPGDTAPPEVSDGYPLVSAVGEWDDHAVENVRPLISDLAVRSNTNTRSDFVATGTCLDELAAGATELLSVVGGSPAMMARIEDTPTLDQLASAVGAGNPAVLLLGFWQHHPIADWQRIGGHYVALEAVDRTEGRILIADPFRDRDAPAENASAHNDAARVSHDEWRVSPSLRPSTPLWLEGYLADDLDLVEILANFQAMNGRSCPDAHSPWLEGARLEAQIEAALVLEPTPVTEASATPSTAETPVASETPSAPATPSASPTGKIESPTASSTGEAAATTTPTGEVPTSEPTPSPTPTAMGTMAAPTTAPTPAASASPAATPSVTPDALQTEAPASPTASPTATNPGPGSPAPTPTAGVGHLCGRITDIAREAAVVAADVWLLVDGDPIAFTRTDAAGEYCFLDLPTGWYELRIRAAGCSPSGRLVEVVGGTNHADVAVECRTNRALLPFAMAFGRSRAP